jgi:hypothetical protein
VVVIIDGLGNKARRPVRLHRLCICYVKREHVLSLSFILGLVLVVKQSDRSGLRDVDVTNYNESYSRIISPYLCVKLLYIKSSLEHWKELCTSGFETYTDRSYARISTVRSTRQGVPGA